MTPVASPPRREPLLRAALGATVFLSALLLFQVQPMAGKRILPWFGGGPAVWTATMLFFQSALVGGYLYAHLLTRRAPSTAQSIIHGLLLALAVGALVVNGLVPGERWKPPDSSRPVLRVLFALAASVGLPYLVLSATAPLVQAWLARSRPGVSPYRLYALSNVGSLAALVTYPFLVEPHLGLGAQSRVWTALFVMLAVLAVVSGRLLLFPLSPGEGQGEETPAQVVDFSAPAAAPTKLQRFSWFALPGCASLLLLAVTNFLCQDVASIPLWWIAPLVVYLLTFILAFDSDRWYRRDAFFPLFAASAFAACFIWDRGGQVSIGRQIAVHLALLFFAGMICHGELARLRPAGERLTAYYLAIAIGGALGGVFAGLIAPLAFSDHYELQAGILVVWVLAMMLLAADRRAPFYDGRRFPVWALMAILWAALGVTMFKIAASQRGAMAQVRNFYGVLKVREETAGGPDVTYRVLTNGRIQHGAQLTSPANRRVPTEYYRDNSGVGQTLLQRDPNVGRRVGVVGLGAGTLAAYAEPGDEYYFFDVNPLVVEFAEKYFTYLADARERGAKIEIVDGDARLSLERTRPLDLDVLVLDAFTGDSIPVHLLTLEAFDLYGRHMSRRDGVIAVHVSNRYLDLEPVVHAAAIDRGMKGVMVVRQKDDRLIADSTSIWILLSRDPERFAKFTVSKSFGEGDRQRSIPWTDD